jgi:hypothetical protein
MSSRSIEGRGKTIGSDSQHCMNRCCRIQMNCYCRYSIFNLFLSPSLLDLFFLLSDHNYQFQYYIPINPFCDLMLDLSHCPLPTLFTNFELVLISKCLWLLGLCAVQARTRETKLKEALEPYLRQDVSFYVGDFDALRKACLYLWQHC